MKKGAKPPKTSFARAARAGIGDLASRLPEFRELQKCSLALFGLGCIGAPSALDFARSGMGRLQVLDHDIVDPGTVVRWPHGLTAAGRWKAELLFNEISRDYPWVKCTGRGTRIGLADQTPPEREVLDAMLTGVDLVYDASAEIGVQDILSTAARERGLPYVCVSGTFGGWGGMVARFNHRPGSGCWWCFQAALDNTIPTPRADPHGEIQPPGCNRVTYAGANFDLTEVALQGVRLSVATLLTRRGVANADYPWDVAIVNLRDDGKGCRILPEWTSHVLERNPDCPVCREA